MPAKTTTSLPTGATIRDGVMTNCPDWPGESLRFGSGMRCLRFLLAADPSHGGGTAGCVNAGPLLRKETGRAAGAAGSVGNGDCGVTAGAEFGEKGIGCDTDGSPLPPDG